MRELHIRRNVITSIAAFGFNILLTFVGFRLVIQQGGTSALGLWSALTAAIYVIRLGDVGMGSATERHVAATDAQSQPELVRGYLDTALLLNTALFMLLTIVGWHVLSKNINLVIPGNAIEQAEALRILPLMLAGFVISNLANVVSGALRGLHLGWQAAYLSMVGAMVQMGATIALVPTMGVEGLAWAQVVQNLLIGLWTWVLFNRHLNQKNGTRLPTLPRFASRSLLRDLFSFSLRAQAVNLVNGIFEPISKLMVGHSSGMAVLGIFEMAYKIVALPRNAVVSGVLGMTPALTRLLTHDSMEAAKLYRRARRMVTAGAGGVLVLVTAGSPLISITILGHVDALLVWFVSIISVGFWLNSIGAPAYALGFAAGRLKANLLSSLLSVVTVLLVGRLLQQIWPVHGPVVATAMAIALSGLLILWLNQRLIRSIYATS